ncbi:MAG: CXXX repeat peptide modification system protein [Candidatus Amulumruptor caecigallinarius]|nr:CXXX repeat peptide modification system protein [Candidatus Amulumruptor caecigallinarius]MCM1396516.1 CXXX repeat peptide modification system protein [Candidatus Amulumruptor caecigallinarius]MCM1453426.1 CXXX repeat peptide modification system protein [bacterium]
MMISAGSEGGGVTLAGKVTKRECRELRALYARVEGLRELAAALPEAGPELKEKLSEQLADAERGIALWWERMRGKYGWTVPEGSRLDIDAYDCRVYLVAEGL